MDGAVSEIYGNESYFLGKKTYIDMLESNNKDNDIITEEHIRMREIPTACIKYYNQPHNITALIIYKKLYEGEAIEFDLTNEGNNFVCENNRDHTVPNVTRFTRTTKCIRYENDKILINSL